MQYKAKKRFGQNFLNDSTIIERIISNIAPGPEDAIVEIGPGLGALTRRLITRLKKLSVVEIDTDLVKKLKQSFIDSSGIEIHQADALAFDFSHLVTEAHSLRVVGNLPYNISTPILFHLLSYAEQIKDMHFMLQKEVVDRIVAQPGSSHYGRLSVMMQYYCQCEFLFQVPPEAFTPKPKVDSAIVRLVPHKQLPFLAKSEENLAKVVKIAFNQRRKTIVNSLKGLINKEIILDLGIDPQQRPQELTLEIYVLLSNTLDN